MAGAMTSPLAHRFQAILDRREHDGTLARHGNARSQSSPPPINCIARKPIKIRDPAYMSGHVRVWQVLSYSVVTHCIDDNAACRHFSLFIPSLQCNRSTESL